eukprot:GHVT01069063.1.p1 GENE.GHVT01069063.1~~GHVT01069063.1.p1  ORF type:complete len:301 (-),score=10.35 GHVT01069063.1:454-1356(-)
MCAEVDCICSCFTLGFSELSIIMKNIPQELPAKSRRVDGLETCLEKRYGEFVPVVQQCLISSIPYFPIGRDNLASQGALGFARLQYPGQAARWFWNFFFRSRNKALELLNRRKYKNFIQIWFDQRIEYMLLVMHKILKFLAKASRMTQLDKKFALHTEFWKSLVDIQDVGMLEEYEARQKGREEFRYRHYASQLRQLLSRQNIDILVVCDTLYLNALSCAVDHYMREWESQREWAFDDKIRLLEGYSYTRHWQKANWLQLILPGAFLTMMTAIGGRALHKKISRGEIERVSGNLENSSRD